MAYFVGRSVAVIVLAFVLGVLVGWLWWRRRKVHFGESQAIAELTTKQEARSRELSAAVRAKDDEVRAKDSALRARDEELGALRARLDAEPAARPSTQPSPRPSTNAPPTDLGVPATAAAPAMAGFVAVPSDPAPETLERLATPVEEIRTEGDHSPAIGGGGDGDDLERIEGIGPRIGAALRGAGIRTYAQLAEADPATLQSALEHAGLRFAPSLPTWGRQAELLAVGDEAGFLQLTQQLVGGRDVSGAN